VTKDAMMAIGVWTGVPLAPIGKSAAYIMDVKANKIKQKGKPGSALRAIDTARGVLTGKGSKK
jgi:hypothetical protein